jgi:hypothetical protein
MTNNRKSFIMFVVVHCAWSLAKMNFLTWTLTIQRYEQYVWGFQLKQTLVRAKNGQEYSTLKWHLQLKRTQARAKMVENILPKMTNWHDLPVMHFSHSLIEAKKAMHFFRFIAYITLTTEKTTLSTRLWKTLSSLS